MLKRYLSVGSRPVSSVSSGLGLFARSGLFLVALGFGATAHGNPPKPLLSIKPDKGYIDDAMALTEGGQVFLYVHTDGLKFASLRGVPLPKGPGFASPPPQAGLAATQAGPAAPPNAKGPGKAKPAAVLPPPPPPPPPPFMEEALFRELSATPAIPLGKELLTGLPLNTSRLHLLPDDKVLLVMRDLEQTGAYTATIYSLKTRAPVTTVGGIGPATDISLTTIEGQPVILAVQKPGPQTPDNPRSLLYSEYKFSGFSGLTGKPMGQKTYKLDEEGRITTPHGSALPLYFLDGYATWVVKQAGAYDKKKDIRQPDVVAYLDVLTGKPLTQSSKTILDPPALMELRRLRTAHATSAAIVAEEATHAIDLMAAVWRGLPDGPQETKTLLALPRPAKKYDVTSLRFARLTPSALLMSLMVDPVNEEAVANKRTDPDEVDFCLVHVDQNQPHGVECKLTLRADKRPLGWVAAPSGRIVVLRKHKGFSRGGSQADLHNL